MSFNYIVCLYSIQNNARYGSYRMYQFIGFNSDGQTQTPTIRLIRSAIQYPSSTLAYVHPSTVERKKSYHEGIR